ncbi:MAG: DMT family transporter [Bacteroidota bacterium]|nr:DMT family transporter [Bacteroidota bacterium]
MIWFCIALFSAFLSAFSAIAQKKVLFKLGALEFSFLLAIVNLLLSIPFFFYLDYQSLTTVKVILLLVKSIIGVFAFLCVMLSLKNLEISNALPLLALTPGFVAIFAFLFLGEGLKYTEVVGLQLLIFGTFILESKNDGNILSPVKTFFRSKYHHYILMALLLFTISSIMDKLMLKQFKFTPIALVSFQNIFFALIFGIIYLFSSQRSKLPTVSGNKKEFAWILVISVLTFGYRYTQMVAIGMASVALVLAVKRTSVFWATIIGGKIFNEKYLLKKTIAALLILAGTILILRE